MFVGNLEWVVLASMDWINKDIVFGGLCDLPVKLTEDLCVAFVVFVKNLRIDRPERRLPVEQCK